MPSIWLTLQLPLKQILKLNVIFSDFKAVKFEIIPYLLKTEIAIYFCSFKNDLLYWLSAGIRIDNC